MNRMADNLSFFRKAMTAAALLTVVFAMFFSAAAPVFAVPPKEGRGKRGECRSQVFGLADLGSLPSAGPAGTGSRRKVRGQTTPEYIPLVMIVIGFEDQPYSDAYDWASAIFAGDKSLSKYYSDMSCGKFTFLPVQESSAYGEGGNTNAADAADDGIIHVRLDLPKRWGWGIEDPHPDADTEMMTAFSRALEAAADHMDFLTYDTDHDGTIQNTELAVGFIAAGKDAAKDSSVYSAAQNTFLWPHAWSFSQINQYYHTHTALPEPDGVTVDGYITIPENSRTGIREDIGVLAHELGHYIGLPDLYSTLGQDSYPWSSYKVDCLSLMDYGCYGKDADGNDAPYSLDIWSKVLLGWTEPETAEAGTYHLTSSSAAASKTEEQLLPALRINTCREGEYYLVENRRFTGWDAAMRREFVTAPASADGRDDGGGLLFWHIDDNVYERYRDDNRVNDADHHPAVMPAYMESLHGTNVQLGGSVSIKKGFYDQDIWNDAFFLPVYGTVSADSPDDRELPADPQLQFLNASSSVMQVHIHSWGEAVYEWSEDLHTVTARSECVFHCGQAREERTDTESAVLPASPCDDTNTVLYTADFKNDLFTSQTKTVTIPVTAHHTLTKTAASAASPEKAGNEEYWTCSLCGRFFSDADGLHEIKENSWLIPKTASTEAAAASAGKSSAAESTAAAESADDTSVSAAETTEQDTQAADQDTLLSKVEKSILSSGSDADPAGSVFRVLRLKSTVQTKKSITLTWRKVKGAKKYILYANRCGKKNGFRKLAVTVKNKKVCKKAGGKKIRKGIYYKFIVAAVDRNNRVISVSKVVHAAAKGGKYANPKSLQVNVRKNQLSLKTGSRFRLRTTVNASPSGQKLRIHRGICFESTNRKVASVSRKGLIRGKKPGTCSLFIYAQNGVFRKIKVKVE